MAIASWHLLTGLLNAWVTQYHALAVLNGNMDGENGIKNLSAWAVQAFGGRSPD